MSNLHYDSWNQSWSGDSRSLEETLTGKEPPTGGSEAGNLIDYTTALARIAVLSTGTGEELSGIEKTVSEAAGLFNTGMASAFRFGQDATLKHLTGTGVPPHAVRKL